MEENLTKRKRTRPVIITQGRSLRPRKRSVPLEIPSKANKKVISSETKKPKKIKSSENVEKQTVVAQVEHYPTFPYPPISHGCQKLVSTAQASATPVDLRETSPLQGQDENLASPPESIIEEFVASTVFVPEPVEEVEVAFAEADFVLSLEGVPILADEAVESGSMVELYLGEHAFTPENMASTAVVEEITEANLYSDLDVPSTVIKMSQGEPVTNVLPEPEVTENVLLAAAAISNHAPLPLVKPSEDLPKNRSNLMPKKKALSLEEYKARKEKEISLKPLESKPSMFIVQSPINRQPVSKKLVSNYLREIDRWRCLVTCPPRTGRETKHCIPTHWIMANGSYVKQCKNYPTPNEGNSIFEHRSQYDGAWIQTEVRSTGAVFFTRFGQTAQIRSAVSEKGDPNGIAGQRFFEKLPRLEIPPKADKQKVGKKKNKKTSIFEGYPTEEIPLRCPYWAKLVRGLEYPSHGAIPFALNSTVDGVRCLLFIEANGRVTVTRNQIRVELAPPF